MQHSDGNAAQRMGDDLHVLPCSDGMQDACEVSLR
jgi:hypothetical protein